MLVQLLREERHEFKVCCHDVDTVVFKLLRLMNHIGAGFQNFRNASCVAEDFGVIFLSLDLEPVLVVRKEVKHVGLVRIGPTDLGRAVRCQILYLCAFEQENPVLCEVVFEFDGRRLPIQPQSQD